jgi:hypothetical protein
MELRRFGLAAILTLNLPVREQILVPAAGAPPGSLHGIGPPLMEHFNDKVAMKTHRGVAVDPLVFADRFADRFRRHDDYETSSYVEN